MSPTASFQRVWVNQRCSIYDHKNEQLLNFHIITSQILTYKAPKNVKHFKVIKSLKSLQKAEAYLEPKQASVMDHFYEYT